MKNSFLFLIVSVVLWACSGSPDGQAAGTKAEAPKAQATAAPVPAQQVSAPIPKGQATLSGKIVNTKNAPVVVAPAAGGPQVQGKVGPDGAFTVMVYLDEPGYFVMSYARQRATVFLAPDMASEVSFDANKYMRSMVFSGQGAAENNYLVAKHLLEEKLTGSRLNEYKLEEKAYADKMEQKYQGLKVHFDELLKKEKGKLHETFVRLEPNNLLYTWANARAGYARGHTFYAKKKGFVPSAEYNKYVERLNLNDGSLVKLAEYRNFLNAYVNGLGEAAMQTKPELNALSYGPTLAKMEAIAQQFSAQPVKDFLAFDVMQQHFRYFGANGLSKLMPLFDQSCKNPAFVRQMAAAKQQWAALEEGQPAPVFSYNDIGGKMVSLADFKGKYAYVDVWATWCGPCRTEIPHLESLQEHYTGKDIAFLSVSIDQNKKAWEKMVKDRNLKGVQLIADRAGASGIAQDYMIKGIPRFLLIDKAGKIVTAHAPRPSSPQIRAMLDGLLRS